MDTYRLFVYRDEGQLVGSAVIIDAANDDKPYKAKTVFCYQISQNLSLMVGWCGLRVLCEGSSDGRAPILLSCL